MLQIAHFDAHQVALLKLSTPIAFIMVYASSMMAFVRSLSVFSPEGISASIKRSTQCTHKTWWRLILQLVQV